MAISLTSGGAEVSKTLLVSRQDSSLYGAIACGISTYECLYCKAIGQNILPLYNKFIKSFPAHVFLINQI